LLKNADDSPWHIIALEDDQTDVEQLVQQLAALPEVDKVVTLLDMVPDHQDEKMALIEEMAMTLGPITFAPVAQKAIDVNAQRTALQELQLALDRLVNEQPSHAAINK